MEEELGTPRKRDWVRRKGRRDAVGPRKEEEEKNRKKELTAAPRDAWSTVYVSSGVDCCIFGEKKEIFSHTVARGGAMSVVASAGG